MPNTYTQLHTHIVFAVQNRLSLVHDSWKNELYKYITGIIHNQNHKLLAINGMPDHIHIFIGMRPDQSVSNLVQDIKGDSSKWINRQNFCRGKFSWQEGFGGFSYSKSHVDNVIEYILNQETHHKRISFIEEYRKLLIAFDVQFDDKYLFKPVT